MEFLGKSLNCILIYAVPHSLNHSYLLLRQFALVDHFGVLPWSEVIRQAIYHMHRFVQFAIKWRKGEEIATNANHAIHQTRQTVQTVQGHTTALRKTAYD
jgi:hypothetical protein